MYSLYDTCVLSSGYPNFISDQKLAFRLSLFFFWITIFIFHYSVGDADLFLVVRSEYNGGKCMMNFAFLLLYLRLTIPQNVSLIKIPVTNGD